MKFRPEMEVVRFSSEDVIAASGGLTNGSKMTFSNFGNGDFTDNKIDFDYRSPSYQFTSSTTGADVVSAVGAKSDTEIWSGYSGRYIKISDVIDSLKTKNDTNSGTWNYTYVYDSAANHFTRTKVR